MEPILLEATDDTPMVILDKVNNKFELSGRSLPEDVIKFYEPIFKWLENYAANPNEKTEIKVKIDYFNSASQRALNEVLTILSRAHNKGKDILVNWHYNVDDEDILEAGKEFEELTKLPFKYISYIPE